MQDNNQAASSILPFILLFPTSCLVGNTLRRSFFRYWSLCCTISRHSCVYRYVCLYVPTFIGLFMKSADYELDLEMDSFQRIWIFPPCQVGLWLRILDATPNNLLCGWDYRSRIRGAEGDWFSFPMFLGLRGWQDEHRVTASEAEPATEYSGHVSFSCSAITHRCWRLPGTLPLLFRVRRGCWRA